MSLLLDKFLASITGFMPMSNFIAFCAMNSGCILLTCSVFNIMCATPVQGSNISVSPPETIERTIRYDPHQRWDFIHFSFCNQTTTAITLTKTAQSCTCFAVFPPTLDLSPGESSTVTLQLPRTAPGILMATATFEDFDTKAELDLQVLLTVLADVNPYPESQVFKVYTTGTAMRVGVMAEGEKINRISVIPWSDETPLATTRTATINLAGTRATCLLEWDTSASCVLQKRRKQSFRLTASVESTTQPLLSICYAEWPPTK